MDPNSEVTFSCDFNTLIQMNKKVTWYRILKAGNREKHVIWTALGNVSHEYRMPSVEDGIQSFTPDATLDFDRRHVLILRKARDEDEGEYACAVNVTDAVYNSTYQTFTVHGECSDNRQHLFFFLF